MQLPLLQLRQLLFGHVKNLSLISKSVFCLFAEAAAFFSSSSICDFWSFNVAFCSKNVTLTLAASAFACLNAITEGF